MDNFRLEETRKGMKQKINKPSQYKSKHVTGLVAILTSAESCLICTMCVIVVVDVEFHPNPNPTSSATKSEPSGNYASHSSGNGYKATPVNL